MNRLGNSIATAYMVKQQQAAMENGKHVQATGRINEQKFKKYLEFLGKYMNHSDNFKNIKNLFSRRINRRRYNRYY